jgi:putative acetyltransferase
MRMLKYENYNIKDYYLLGDEIMNIRKYREDEIEELVELWYDVSIKAHSFISDDYWRAGKKDMREKYIPMSATYVIEDNEEIIGFVSIVDDYLAAIFIGTNYQDKGYGNKLLDYIKTKKDYIELRVYKKNEKTVKFYLKNDFHIQEESIDELTGEEEFLMVWNKEK